MSDTFATIAERDQYFDSLVHDEGVLLERKMNELRRAYAENLRQIEDRRKLAVVGESDSSDLDNTQDIEGDEMQDDEEAGVL